MNVVKAMTVGVLMKMVMTSHWPPLFLCSTWCAFNNYRWMFCGKKHWCAISVLFAFIIVKFLWWVVIAGEQNVCNYSFANQIHCQHKPAFSGKCKNIICFKTGAIYLVNFQYYYKLTASLRFSLYYTLQIYWIYPHKSRNSLFKEGWTKVVLKVALYRYWISLHLLFNQLFTKQIGPQNLCLNYSEQNMHPNLPRW